MASYHLISYTISYLLGVIVVAIVSCESYVANKNALDNTIRMYGVTKTCLSATFSCLIVAAFWPVSVLLWLFILFTKRV